MCTNFFLGGRLDIAILAFSAFETGRIRHDLVYLDVAYNQGLLMYYFGEA
jgi:hypothetical protein